jgi:hypothetical protein
MNSAPTNCDDWLNEFDSEGLKLLTPDELALFHRLTEPPLWTPYAGPQTWGYESLADVLGFGGAAGGGKTFLLLGLGATRHKRSLLLRREHTNTREMEDQARELFGKLGSFNANTGVWRDLPGGRQIEFGGCPNPGDEHKHKGRAKDFLGIDEADQFPESVVRFLMGWVRTADPSQRTRTVLCFNPPGAEGRWLLDYFMPWLAYLFPAKFTHPRPAPPGEIRWFARIENRDVERPNGSPFTLATGETVTPKSRTFIPARITDNPALMRTNYPAQLQAMPEPFRSQLLYGDMSAGLEDDPWQVIPTGWVQAAMGRWRDGGDSGALSAVGVDVARGDPNSSHVGDQTVIVRRYNNWFARPEKHPGKTTPDGPAVVTLIESALGAWRSALVNVDVIGIGGSVFDGCRSKGLYCMGVNFAHAVPGCTDKSGLLYFVNLRAFAYWSMRELLDPANGHDVSLPPDPELLGDLTTPKFEHMAGGIKVRSKEEIRQQLGRSTDVGDAIVLSILLPGPGMTSD